MSKENEYDALGQRMKRYEEVANGQLLIPDLPLYARIDGRHFSKLTKNLGYPFKDLPDEKRSFVFSQLMQMTAHDLMEEFKCDVAETHSDEISLGWKNIKTAPFDGKMIVFVEQSTNTHSDGSRTRSCLENHRTNELRCCPTLATI